MFDTFMLGFNWKSKPPDLISSIRMCVINSGNGAVLINPCPFHEGFAFLTLSKALFSRCSAKDNLETS